MQSCITLRYNALRPRKNFVPIVVARSNNSVTGHEKYNVKSWDSYNKWIARQPEFDKGRDLVDPYEDIAIIKLVNALGEHIKQAFLPYMAQTDLTGLKVNLLGVTMSKVMNQGVKIDSYGVLLSEKSLVIMDEVKCLEHLSNDYLGGTTIRNEVKKGSILCTRGPPTLDEEDTGGVAIAGSDVVVGVNRFSDSSNRKESLINYHVNIPMYIKFIKSKVGCGKLHWKKI
ncbi:hypothetical protein QAD02_016502 [Eretmocerus hayati]|uniref:Uncharacterized protein n=1 Tax=Eretmocerus hayati TaxID=131215 RepID=A0ACC2PG24_9HYME|nr:hypothetical protein QAD02_016502 [Eretmocerus hayati]